MNKKTKHGLIFVLVFMLLCNSMPFGRNVQTVHAQNQTTSIITNGDFETTSGDSVTASKTTAGTFAIGNSGWSYYMSSSYKVDMKYEIVSGGRGNSGNALKVSNAETPAETDSGKGVVRQWDIALPKLESGTKYLLTVYAKPSDDINSGSYVQLVWDGASTDEVRSTAKTQAEDGWYVYTLELDTTNSSATGNKLEIHEGTLKTGYWLIDDVSVKQIPTITVEDSVVSMETGDSETITAVLDDPHNVFSNKTITYSSSNENVATVDNDGKITALSEGETTITIKSVEDENVTATCVITVTKASGENTNNAIINGDFEATSGDSVIASKTTAGTFAIGNSGWSYYMSSSYKVDMKYEIVSGGRGNSGNALKVSNAETPAETDSGKGVVRQWDIALPKLESGTKYLLTVYAKPSDDINSGSYVQLVWDGASTDEVRSTAKTQAEDGWYVYTLELDTTNSSATGNKLEIHEGTLKTGYWLIDDVSVVEVIPDEPTISVNPAFVEIKVEDTAAITATLTDNDIVLGESPVWTWTSSDETVATVSGNSGSATITAKKEGNAKITVTVTNASDSEKSFSAECNVTVTAAQSGELETTSIVKNGDFEKVSNVSVTALSVNNGGSAGSYDIGTTDWKYYMAGSYTVSMQYDIVATGRGDSGNAMKISNAAGQSETTEGRGVIRQDNIALPELEAGANYQLTIHAKASDDIHTGSYIQLRWIKGDRTKETTLNKASSVDENGWSVYTIELNKENSVATGNGIQIYAWNMGTGYWLIDDVSIKKVPVLTIDKSEVNLEIGKSTEIQVSLTDDDKVLGENPTLTYSSNDTTVATVAEENGTVTINAVGIGEAVITVKSAEESVYAECVVKVTPKKIIVNGDFAAGLDSNWTTGTATDVTYTSIAEGRTDNALKVAVSDGVTGAVSGVFEQLLDAKVTEGLVANGSKYLVTVYAKPEGANSDSAVTVSWYDSEGATAKTSEIKANTTAGSDGWIPVTLEFTAGDVSATGTNLEVQVSNLASGYWLFDDIFIKRVPYVSLTPAEMNIVVGERAEIDATMIDPDYILDKSGAFDYSSADESIAKVDLRGRVTGVNVGTTTITVTSAYYPEYSATLDVTVSAIALTAISLPESLNLCVAEQEELSVTFTPANATNQAISWTSSDAGVAVVDENGLVTGINAGTATITATGANNLTASCTVTVRKSTTLLTEDAKITSTTYQEVVDSFVEFVTNNTGAEASYTLYEAPENGVLTVNEDGSFSYIPRNGQVGDSETFTVIVNAGTEYAFLKGTIELVETIDDSDTPSDSDTDTDSDVQVPEIVESATDDSYTLGSNAEVTIKSTGDFAKFESVEMDGKIVDESNYTVKEGSTIVTFKTAYLETLSVGEHIVTINYKDGSDVNAKLTLLKKADVDTNTDNTDGGDNNSDNAETTESAGDTVESTKTADTTKTGDNSNMGLWLLLLATAVASLGCAGCTLYKKNKGGK